MEEMRTKKTEKEGEYRIIILSNWYDKKYVMCSRLVQWKSLFEYRIQVWLRSWDWKGAMDHRRKKTKTQQQTTN